MMRLRDDITVDGVEKTLLPPVTNATNATNRWAIDAPLVASPVLEDELSSTISSITCNPVTANRNRNVRFRKSHRIENHNDDGYDDDELDGCCHQDPNPAKRRRPSTPLPNQPTQPLVFTGLAQQHSSSSGSGSSESDHHEFHDPDPGSESDDSHSDDSSFYDPENTSSSSSSSSCNELQWYEPDGYDKEMDISTEPSTPCQNADNVCSFPPTPELDLVDGIAVADPQQDMEPARRRLMY
jgi:hypothetical protein